MRVEEYSKKFLLQPTEGTGNSNMLACVAKVSDPSNLKILTPK